MEVFGNMKKIRGCFNRFTIPTDNGSGAAGGRLSFIPDHRDIIVVGASMQLSERNKILPCFGDTSYFYAFGHNVEASRLSVTAVAMLIGVSGDWSGSAEIARGAYNTSRVYAYHEQVYFSLGFDVVPGYLVGFRDATMDAEHNLHQLVFDIVVPKPMGANPTTSFAGAVS